MKAIVCDKCKKVITDEEKLKHTTRLDMYTNNLGKYSEKHLCEDCRSGFYDWLKDE